MINQQTTRRGYLTQRSRLPHRSIAAASLLIIIVLTTGAVALAQAPGRGTKSFLLVASRSMPDPVFQKSVILMLPQDEPPLVAGVIVNKPTNVTLGNLFRQPLASGNGSEKVYFGGPVDLTTPVLLVRTSRPPKGSIELWGNVHAVMDPSAINELLKEWRAGNDARLFLGRAQWAQEQLRGELLEGSWTVVPVSTDLLFEPDSAKLWPKLSQHEHMREVAAQSSGDAGIQNFELSNELSVW